MKTLYINGIKLFDMINFLVNTFANIKFNLVILKQIRLKQTLIYVISKGVYIKFKTQYIFY